MQELPCPHHKSESGCKFCENCVFRHTEVDSQPSKKPKTSFGNVALLKISKQLGCGFQDLEPPKSKSISRKSTRFLGPKRSVERKGPSQGVIQKCEPLTNVVLMLPKFEDRTQELTVQQERFARRNAWELAKNDRMLGHNDKATSYSPSEVWSLPAPSSKKPEERYFVVDSRASMHMLSRKDLNLDELETVRSSRNLTTVITANGAV